MCRRMTEEDMMEIEKILGNKPQAYNGYGSAGWQRVLRDDPAI